jgi:hypothetical protein
VYGLPNWSCLASSLDHAVCSVQCAVRDHTVHMPCMQLCSSAATPCTTHAARVLHQQRRLLQCTITYIASTLTQRWHMQVPTSVPSHVTHNTANSSYCHQLSSSALQHPTQAWHGQRSECQSREVLLKLVTTADPAVLQTWGSVEGDNQICQGVGAKGQPAAAGTALTGSRARTGKAGA